MSTQGRRVYPREDGGLYLAEGDYGFNPRYTVGARVGCWECRPPGCHAGSLPDHSITEHEDGTITVSPSIVLQDEHGATIWHGFLERGAWRQV